jgi:propanol-preferring alcohol dehydrogenase
VRLRVEACGVCHSDSATVQASDLVALPRVPGHEVIGRIEAVGEDVEGWAIGQRAGVGFLAGEDGTCLSCRRGDFVNCDNPTIAGITCDGGYAEVMLADARGLVRIPESLNAIEAAPLLCAGLTTFNALRNASARAGDIVAIFGLGGLGHLAVQFARKMGFHTVAIARGADKAGLAIELGAHRYIDASVDNPAAVLQEMGGAKLVLGTAPSGKGMSDLVPGLAARGVLQVVAVPSDPLEIMASTLVFGGRHVAGTLTGTVVDNEETLAFALLQGIKPMVEIFPLERAQEAYDRMMRADVRFRAVLVMNTNPNGVPTHE